MLLETQNLHHAWLPNPTVRAIATLQISVDDLTDPLLIQDSPIYIGPAFLTGRFKISSE